MNRIEEVFYNKKAFVGFLTAGDPSIEKTEEFILTMEKAGVDLIEIGIPFSDPIAEGSVIESANGRALKNGATVEKIFAMVKRVREKTQVPLVFLTYCNPVFQYGYQKFFVRCKECGIDGIILPDVPYEEDGEIKEIANRYQINVISLVAPTSDKRISKIAKDAQGFLYVVSSMGITGVRNDISVDFREMIQEIRNNTTIPTAVGFGISTPEQAVEIVTYADGVIVGSAIVKIIETYGEQATTYLYDYCKEIKEAIL